MSGVASVKVGEWVQVRSKEEILATLNQNGRLEGLPFMPEMFSFCGQRLRVFKSAHKTCDPPNGLLGRRMSNAVHLEGVRCTGEAHGGCQAGCLVFWKESWLESDDSGSLPADRVQGMCTEEDVLRATRCQECPSTPGQPRYACQSTQIADATQPLRWWDIRQYVQDYTSGNVKLSQMIGSFVASVYYELASAGVGLGAPMRWVYDIFQTVRSGTPYPWRIGRVPNGTRTPAVQLNLRAGELVRIKSYAQILETLDEKGHNRGMWFDAELVPYCGGTYRVLQRVSRILNEKTGCIQELKNDCIVLEDVVCRACYARNRKFCPRGIFAYWREVWLERV